MDFQDRHVVVTGGTGALGSAVVETLLGAGAHCVVPWMVETELKRFARRDDPHVKLVQVPTLSDERMAAIANPNIGPTVRVSCANRHALRTCSESFRRTARPYGTPTSSPAIRTSAL